MTQVNYLYNLGFTDGLNNKTLDPRYNGNSAYLQGYDQGQEQRKINIKRLIIRMKNNGR